MNRLRVRGITFSRLTAFAVGFFLFWLCAGGLHAQITSFALDPASTRVEYAVREPFGRVNTGATSATGQVDVLLNRSPNGPGGGFITQFGICTGDISVNSYFSASLTNFCMNMVNPGTLVSPPTGAVTSPRSPDPQTRGDFGYAAAGVPDLNNDGRGEVLIGAPGETDDPTTAGAGRAYLFSAFNNALQTTLSPPVLQTNGNFGTAVGWAPDVNGDNIPDLLVGAAKEVHKSLFDGKEGQVHVFSGSRQTSYPLLRTINSPNPNVNGSFGYALAGIEDVNNDGRGDIVVGAHLEPSGGFEEQGRVYIMSGATGALIRTIECPIVDTFGLFGTAISIVPDANGDGYDDILVGAYRHNGALVDQGAVYVFSSRTGAQLHQTFSPNATPGGEFGVSISGVPDIDGDGRGDYAVGAQREAGNTATFDAGNLHLFSGATGNLIRSIYPVDPGNQMFFGNTVQGLADVDGDGRGDVAVRSVKNGTGAARVFVFSGATGRLIREVPAPANFAAQGNWGQALAAVPDINEDGLPDLLITSTTFQPGNVFQGGGGEVFTNLTRGQIQQENALIQLEGALAYNFDIGLFNYHGTLNLGNEPALDYDILGFVQINGTQATLRIPLNLTRVIDVGLGALNPVVTFTGTLVGTATLETAVGQWAVYE